MKRKILSTAGNVVDISLISILCLIVVAGLFVIGLSACTKTDEPPTPESANVTVYKGNILELVAEDDTIAVSYYVETRTGAMYFCKYNSGSGVLEMTNPDTGLPLLYDEWVKMPVKYNDILGIKE